MAKLKINDKVIIIAGKDKGKQGTILGVHDNEYVRVEGANIIKKHTKPNPQKGIQGGIVSKEKPIHISNVAIFNPKSGKKDRVRFKFDDNGQKVRIFASDNELVDL